MSDLSHATNDTQYSYSVVILQYRRWDYTDYAFTVIVAFGLLGNSLTILIMNSKRMCRNYSNSATTASIFITSMAISDMALLLIKLVYILIRIYRIETFHGCLILTIVKQTSTIFNVWIIVTTCAERALAVLRPFYVGHVFSRTNSKIILASLFAFIFTLTSSLCISCMEYKSDGLFSCGVKNTEQCNIAYNYIFAWTRSILSSWLPSILIIVLNTATVCKLRRKSSSIRRRRPIKKRKENLDHEDRAIYAELKRSVDQNVQIATHILGSGSQYTSQNQELKVSATKTTPTSDELLKFQSNSYKERQITIMLTTAAFSFVALTLPFSIFELAKTMMIGNSTIVCTSTMNRWLWLIGCTRIKRFFLMLLDINHATNFILYCATTQRFRQELKSLISFVYYTFVPSAASSLSSSSAEILKPSAGRTTARLGEVQ